MPKSNRSPAFPTIADIDKARPPWSELPRWLAAVCEAYPNLTREEALAAIATAERAHAARRWPPSKASPAAEAGNAAETGDAR